MNGMLQEKVRTVGFMFGISLVMISAVSGIHLATAPMVQRNANLYLQEAVMDAAGVAVPADPDAVVAWYDGAVTAWAADPAGGAPDTFEIRDPVTGEVIAYVFRRQGKGLWGAVTCLVGMTPDLKTFRRIAVLDQNETPGLGARIDEEWFRAQFAGKTGPFVMVAEGTRSGAPGEMDAITGATVTSTAVRDMLNVLIPAAAGMVEKR